MDDRISRLQLNFEYLIIPENKKEKKEIKIRDKIRITRAIK